MKCLHIIPWYYPSFIYGGPIYSSAALCKILASYGNDITVITTTANGAVELDVEAGVPHLIEGVNVIYFKRITKDNTHLSPGLLSYLWNNAATFDAIHIHSLWNFVSLFSLTICALKGITPVVSSRGMLSEYVIHTNHPFQKRVLHFFFGKRLLAKARFHATSLSELTEIRKVFPNSNVTVIPNILIDIDKIYVENKITDNEKFIKIIFLGRVDPKKGIEILFEGLAGIEWDFHLSIVGSGTAAYITMLKGHASKLKINDKITWVGPVYGNEKYTLLSNHDLMVLTSYNENFGNVVLESLVCGTPVLVSDKVGLSDYIIDNDFGWVCTINYKTIITMLNNFYSQKQKRNRIRDVAPQVIRDSFSAANLVKLYLDMYVK